MLHLLLAGGVMVYAGEKLYQRLRRKEMPSSLVGKKHADDKKARHSSKGDSQPTTELLPMEKSEIEEEKLVNQAFTITSVSFALATASVLVYPPLIIASLVGITYVTIPIVQKGYKSLVEERRIGAAVVDMIVLPCILISGYYFIAALAYWVYSLGQKLIIKTKESYQKKLISLFGEQPHFVFVLKEGVEVEIPVEALMNGDIVVVNAGETVPVDGIITNGVASIDQHLLTGEAQPSEKGSGDHVFASTLVLSGRIFIQVDKAGKETLAAQISDILTRTVDFKTSIQSRGEEFADRFASPMLGLSAVAL